MLIIFVHRASLRFPSLFLLALALSLSGLCPLRLTVVVGSLSPSLSTLLSITYVSLSRSLAGSPGPEVVMSASAARPIASRRIMASDDVTLEISRPVSQVVSLCTA